MSPTLVYFLMMADDIKDTAGFLAILFSLAAVIAIIATLAFETGANDWTQRLASLGDADRSGHGYTRDELASRAEESRSNAKLVKGLRKWFVSGAVLLICLNTFMPGTKTIAAMVVLPKLTSPQALDAMGSEAKELYDLAKGALKNLVGDEKPATKE